MSFDLRFIGKDKQALKSHLAKYKKPLWLKKVIVHHTYIPTVAQWSGLKSLQGVADYYKGMRWSGGPHFFVGPDGIWQMTPPIEKSIHSNVANDFAVAVEVVGDYDRDVWKDPIYTYACITYAGLLEWANLDLNDLEPHRKYNPEKSCPGRAITMEWVKKHVELHMGDESNSRTVADPITMPVKVWKVRDIETHARVRTGAGFNHPESAQLYSGDIFLSLAEKKDEQGTMYAGFDTWIHITHGYSRMLNNVSNTGFVHRSLVDELK